MAQKAKREPVTLPVMCYCTKITFAPKTLQNECNHL